MNNAIVYIHRLQFTIFTAHILYIFYMRYVNIFVLCCTGVAARVMMNADAWKVTADRTLCSDGTADGILNALTGAEADYFFFVLVG